MGNHVHLAIRTGNRPLKRTMSRLLTGYAQSYNRRHQRSGHLMQNRYKSTIVEEERYFLSLVRYIHLNPVRARICALSGIEVGELFSGSRQREVTRARQIVSYIATRKLGVQAQTVVRTMNVTPPAIAAATKKGPDALTCLRLKAEDLVRGATNASKLIK